MSLRYLVKILYLLKCDKRDNSLNVIVDGGDWSGMALREFIWNHY